ncbi:MAG: hypothetical protein IJF13_08560 [Clostridia bacterium]|nr:hypothetical protein [Clostridia bacterium]
MGDSIRLQYIYLNRRLLSHLSAVADKLIWATTTPVGLGYTQKADGLCAISREEWNCEIALYNNVLSGYLSSMGVVITHLNSVMGMDLDNDGIHLSDKGRELAAQAVATNIRKFLEA